MSFKSEEIDRSKEEVWALSKLRWHNGDDPSRERWRWQHCVWGQLLQKVVKQYIFQSMTVNLSISLTENTYTVLLLVSTDESPGVFIAYRHKNVMKTIPFFPLKWLLVLSVSTTVGGSRQNAGTPLFQE